jgi:hypothetical protein
MAVIWYGVQSYIGGEFICRQPVSFRIKIDCWQDNVLL